jgi:surface antigen
MNHAQWVNANLGKRINGYSENGGQCVDEARDYMKDVWGVNPYDMVKAGNAKHFLNNANTKKVRVIRRKANGQVDPPYAAKNPPKGSILVTDSGRFGHVAVVESSNSDYANTIDQNWSKKHRVTRERHRYTSHGVIGWIIKR